MGDFNQVWEIPKLSSVLSCEVVSTVLGLRRGVWTEPVEKISRNLLCFGEILYIS